MLYIKRISDFKTVAALNVLSSSLCLDSAEQEGSSVTVIGNDVPRSLAGSWAIIDEQIYTISTVTPQDGRTLLALSAPGDAFSRLLPYTAPESGSGGAFAAAQLSANFIHQPDAQYALPYLTVSNLDTSDFVAPDVDSNGLFALSDYFRLLRRLRGIKPVFSLSGDELQLTLTPVGKTSRVIPFNDGHSQLASVAYSDSGLAKITTRHSVARIESTDPETGKVTYAKDDEGKTIYDIETADFYLTESGSVVTSPPARRVQGAWLTLPVAAKDDPAAKAAERFAKAASSHKIEFWSDREFAVFDPCEFSIYGETMESYISYAGTRSTDGRFYYRSGELLLTATEKLKGMMK